MLAVLTNLDQLSSLRAVHLWIAGCYLGSKIGQMNRSHIALSGFIHLFDTHIDDGKIPTNFQF